MIDLDVIKERYKTTSNGVYHVVGVHYVIGEADFNALVAEVEHLRAAIAALQASVPPTHPSDYGHEVWAAARHEAVAEERAAVVAYVRSEANQPHPIEAGERALSPSGRGLLLFYADRIERGEHRREEER